MKHNILRKNIELGVIFGLICAVLLSFSHFDAACGNLRTSVLRLHILANSDSAVDQAVKLLVRDRILEQGSGIFDCCTNLELAEKTAEENIDRFIKAANEVLAEKELPYTATAAVKTEYFDTRVYDDFTLPAGNYRALTVSLGKAEGKNWWCVIFPTVCLGSAKGELSQSAAKESSKIAENAPQYVMKFKAVEWYEEISKAINIKKTEKN